MARKKKTPSGIPKHIEKALRGCWPDGIVEMPIDDEESYLWDTLGRLRSGLSRIKGAFLVSERPPEGEPLSDEELDPNQDLPVRDEDSCSYHMFFITPEGESTKYETEIDSLEDDGDEQTVSGAGIMGCAVGISILAPFAIIMFEGAEEFDDGSYSDPDIEAHIFDGGGDGSFQRDESGETFCKMQVGEQGLSVLAELRRRIARVLKGHHIKVLREDVLRKPIPWLRAGEEVWVGKNGEPITVRTALFFHGL